MFWVLYCGHMSKAEDGAANWNSTPRLPNWYFIKASGWCHHCTTMFTYSHIIVVTLTTKDPDGPVGTPADRLVAVWAAPQVCASLIRHITPSLLFLSAPFINGSSTGDSAWVRKPDWLELAIDWKDLYFLSLSFYLPEKFETSQQPSLWIDRTWSTACVEATVLCDRSGCGCSRIWELGQRLEHLDQGSRMKEAPRAQQTLKPLPSNNCIVFFYDHPHRNLRFKFTC